MHLPPRERLRPATVCIILFFKDCGHYTGVQSRCCKDLVSLHGIGGLTAGSKSCVCIYRFVYWYYKYSHLGPPLRSKAYMHYMYPHCVVKRTPGEKRQQGSVTKQNTSIKHTPFALDLDHTHARTHAHTHTHTDLLKFEFSPNPLKSTFFHLW